MNEKEKDKKRPSWLEELDEVFIKNGFGPINFKEGNGEICARIYLKPKTKEESK